MFSGLDYRKLSMKRSVVEGSLVCHEDKTYRVVGTSRNGEVTLKGLTDNHTFSVPFTELSILEVDGSRDAYIAERRLAWLQQSERNPKEMKVAIERAEGIQLYLSGKLSRAEVFKSLDVSEATFTRLLRRFDPDLGAVSLLRSVRGRKAGTKMLSALHEEIIESAITQFVKRAKKLSSLTELYEYIESRCAVMGLKPPNANTLRKRIDQFGTRPSYSLRFGREEMAQKLDYKPGMVDVETILTMVQIDHTKVDIIIRGANGEPLMRPWLTVVIDLKSRIVLGYYVALHPPSAVSVAMALLSACYPKTEQPLMLGGGVGTLHRFWGKPKAVGTDNAAEFISPAFKASLGLYGMDLLLRPIGKKHFGGHVERLIGTFMGKAHMLPGTTYSNVLSKADYDSAKESALTYAQFCQWFADQVAIYHGRAHEGLGRKTPSEVWDEEMAKLGHDYVPPIPGDFRTFTLDFFPSASRTVGPKGVRLKGAFYASPVLRRLVGKRLSFKYNPLNLGKLWVQLDSLYYEIPYSDISRQPISLSEHWAGGRCKGRRAGELNDPALHALRLKSFDDVEQAVKETKRIRQQTAKQQGSAEVMTLLTNEIAIEADFKPLSVDQVRKKLNWKG